jgi:hypothetical protein
MKLNLNIDKTLHAQVRGRFYPVTVAGKGFPCLSIGLGTIMQRTVSNQFKNIFEVYSSDLYWHKDFALENPYALTMDNILDDLKELGESLKLSNYFLLGHSAWGIIALEFAKKYLLLSQVPELQPLIMLILKNMLNLNGKKLMWNADANGRKKI